LATTQSQAQVARAASACGCKCLVTLVFACWIILLDTLWQFLIAMENDRFIDDLTIKHLNMENFHINHNFLMVFPWFTRG
jgi:hypothetical protein